MVKRLAQPSFRRGPLGEYIHKYYYLLVRPGGTKSVSFLAFRTCDSNTCESPKCTEAVSDIYMIFPSGATTKMNPSRVWRRWEPSSFMPVSRAVVTVGAAPHASPRPANREAFNSCELSRSDLYSRPKY